MTFWFLRRVRVSLLSSRDGASLLHAVVSREHGIVSARKLKQRGRCAKITLELPRQFQASRACPTRRRRSFEIPLARPASGTVGYASMSPRATTRFSRRARRIRARRRVASLASWGGGAPQAITQRIRTPGARVQKLETELFIGFLGGALAALALVGELLQALLQAALDGGFPVCVRSYASTSRRRRVDGVEATVRRGRRGRRDEPQRDAARRATPRRRFRPTRRHPGPPAPS